MEHGALFALGAVVVALVLLQSRVRESSARAAAEKWLVHHGYRGREQEGGSWFRRPSFPARWNRSRNDAIDFRFVVADRRLGGEGVLWLRVWADWLGTVRDEPEVWWERMPKYVESDAAASARTVDAVQFALLRRIASGERRFRPQDEHLAVAREQFDLLVEHVMALQRRGLVTCSTPVAEIRVPGAMYREVGNVTLTAEGARVVERMAGDGDP